MSPHAAARCAHRANRPMTEKRWFQVLVVDDEPGIVQALRRELTRIGDAVSGYAVEGFTDPAAAVERARTKAFDAVITDFRMPGMNGLEFLHALAQIQPDCVSLVLSGQTDMASLVAMVNQTHIFSFIEKPWREEVLLDALARALIQRDNMLEQRRIAGVMHHLSDYLPD